MDESCTKRKKNKRKQKLESGKEIDEIEHKQGKEKKEKEKKSKQANSGDVLKAGGHANIEKDVCMDINQEVTKKRKLSNCGLDDDKSSKKVKRKKNKLQECHNHTDVNEQVDGENAGVFEDTSDINHKKSKKKKSKKKKAAIENDNSAKGVHDQAENSNHNIGEDLALLQGETEGSIDIVKKNKRKKNKHKEQVEYSRNLEGTVGETDEPSHSDVVKKKKKKKEKKKTRDIERSQKESETSAEEKTGVEQTVDHKIKNETSDMDMNETKRNKKDVSNVNTGQWSSVNLGDSERQNKFFRLLGGFKKGNDNSQLKSKFGLGKNSIFNSPSGGTNKVGGNFAMNKNQEDLYTKSLETEYERAMVMNLNRGIGLGFEKPPDEGKNFYIDTKSSKSVKFDD